MVIGCEVVWRDVSNYIEGDVDADLRIAMEEHFRSCAACTSVLEGTRNVIELYSDERMSEVPLGFGNRLQHHLEENMVRKSRRGFLGWAVAAAAAVLLGVSFEIGRFSESGRPAQRSPLAQAANTVPPDMPVVVSADGKFFHGSAACPFIHDRDHLRTIAAKEAEREGYTPCTRCMKKYIVT
jgi:hypothetical protein